MNQPTHAWLAVEAYRKIAAAAQTEEGKQKKLDGLARLLGANLKDVVVAAWLPDCLIKDMSYGHVFKNSCYSGDGSDRFVLRKDVLTKHFPGDAKIPEVAFGLVEESWWNKAYRVKDGGGHLPARVAALAQTVRDMFRMGDADVVELTDIESAGAKDIAATLLYSPRNIATTLWMMSHYIADAHMPFHTDNRALASTAKQDTHCDVEKEWGEQVNQLFHAKSILKRTSAEILAAVPPPGSKFAGLDFGTDIRPLKNEGDPWQESVYICRGSFAASFAWVPPSKAAADDQATRVSLEDILHDGDNCFCGSQRFWDISRAIMIDAVNSIAMFWQDAWVDFTKED